MADSWFFDNSGLNRVNEVFSSLKDKTIDAVNQKYHGSYESYSPWMGDLDNVETLSSIYTSSSFTIESPRELSIIKDHFPIDDEMSDSIQIDDNQHTNLESFNEAKENILNSDLKDLFGSVVYHLVPLSTDKEKVQKIGAGFSSHLAKGAIFLSVPNLDKNSISQMSINLAHELGHQCLNIYQTADPIIENLHEPVYSFVRKAKRPAIMAFHATVALAFMTKFLETFKGNRTLFLSEQYTALKYDFKQSLSSFENIRFTPFGKVLFKDLENYAHGL